MGCSCKCATIQTWRYSNWNAPIVSSRRLNSEPVIRTQERATPVFRAVIHSPEMGKKKNTSPTYKSAAKHLTISPPHTAYVDLYGFTPLRFYAPSAARSAASARPRFPRPGSRYGCSRTDALVHGSRRGCRARRTCALWSQLYSGLMRGQPRRTYNKMKRYKMNKKTDKENSRSRNHR